MQRVASTSTVKVIGANGQISLGKQFAGRQVLVEEHEPGVWHIRAASVIPDNELWLHHPKAAKDLESALAWAGHHPPDDTGVDALIERLRDAE